MNFENSENLDINSANTVFPFANISEKACTSRDSSASLSTIGTDASEISVKSTPSKIPTFQRNTPAKAVKFNTNASVTSSTTKMTKMTKMTPLKLSTATVASTAPTTPSSSREAAMQAKLQSTAERIQKVAGLKDKWAKEKERKMQSHRDKRAEELKRQQSLMSAAAEQRKLLAEKKRIAEEKKKQQERELLRSQMEAANQLSQDMAEKLKSRRRQSIMLNDEIRKRQEEKIASMASLKKLEQDSLSQSKREDAQAVRDAKKQEEMKRRQSMATRTEVARNLKEVEHDLELVNKEEERSLLDFRYASWQDEKQYQKQEEAKRRQSIAARLDSWREQKQIDDDIKSDEFQDAIDNFSMRRQDWQARNEAKAQAEIDRRASIAARLQKWRDENAQMKLTKLEASEAEKYNQELQAQEREDVLNYKLKCQEERRQSMSHRLASAREDKNWERGQIALLAIAAEESRQLEADDRANVLAYKHSEEKKSRESLQFRNECAHQEAIRQETLHQLELEQKNEDYDIKRDDWLCMEDYKQQLRDERRKSLAMRLVMSRKQKEQALNTHRQMLDNMHNEFELKRATWTDVQNYQATERENRRKSVALRLDSWRDQKLASEKLRNQQMLQEEEDAYLKELEAEDLRNAKEAMKNAEKMDLLLGKFAF